MRRWARQLGRQLGQQPGLTSLPTLRASPATGNALRTSLGDQLVAMRRPAALAALASAAGGWIGVRAPTLGVWSLQAQVQALDTTGETTVTRMAGADATPLVWVAVAAGVVIIALSLLVALDRPVAHAPMLVIACGAVLLTVTLGVAMQPPSPADFHGSVATEMLQDGVALPTGVGIELRVEPGPGLLVLGLSGLLAAAGAVVADRRG